METPKPLGANSFCILSSSCKQIFLYSQLEFCLLQLLSIASCPISVYLRRMSGSMVYKRSLRRRRLIRFFLCFHFCRLNKVPSLGLTKSPAPCWSKLSSTEFSCDYWYSSCTRGWNWMVYSRCGPPRTELRVIITFLDLTAMILLM